MTLKAGFWRKYATSPSAPGVYGYRAGWAHGSAKPCGFFQTIRSSPVEAPISMWSVSVRESYEPAGSTIENVGSKASTTPAPVVLEPTSDRPQVRASAIGRSGQPSLRAVRVRRAPSGDSVQP